MVTIYNDSCKIRYLCKKHKYINNKSLKYEVKAIKTKLAIFGVTENDLGINLKLTKDKKGYYFNKYLNSLMLLRGKQIDTNVVGIIGGMIFLGTNPTTNKTPLTYKFLIKNNLKILKILLKRELKNCAIIKK